MKNKRSAVAAILIITGIVMIAAAAALMMYNLWDATRAAKSADAALETIHEIQLENKRALQDQSSDTKKPTKPSGGAATDETTDDLLPFEMKVMVVDGQRYIGTLTFPALEMELPVMADWDNDKMSIAPCRYSGSYLENNMVVCGHNYSTHFGRLEALQQNDEVIFTDPDGNSYHYTVKLTETLAATAIDEMNNSDYDLTLFTCNYSGYARVAVRCDLK